MYSPPITLSQLLFYPEESTGCKLCDAVAEVLQDGSVKNCQMLAQRMGHSVQDLSGAIWIQTGLHLQELIIAFRLAKIKAYILSHPREKQEEVAHRFGFSSRRTLYQFLKKAYDSC